MGYSFTELQNAWLRDIRLGTWQGWPVFACTKQEALALTENDNNYYIVFDDGNALVRQGKRYGTVSEKGNVDEWRWPMPYVAANASATAKTANVSTKTEEPVAAEEVGTTVSLETSSANLDDVLTQAREMTVESLLEGLERFVSFEFPEV